jgi:hypothetical protein
VVELLEAPEGAIVGELVNIEGQPISTPDVQLKSKTALDAWKRVSALLVTNSEGEATFLNSKGEGLEKEAQRFLTTAGSCTVKSLKNAAIR